MRIIYSLIIIATVIFVSGCSLTPEPQVVTKVVYVDKPLTHYPLPEPVNFHDGQIHIITKETIRDYPDNVVFQAFEWNDGQELRISLEDMVRYVQELTAVLCSYRKSLEEARCVPYTLDATIEDPEYEVSDQD